MTHWLVVGTSMKYGRPSVQSAICLPLQCYRNGRDSSQLGVLLLECLRFSSFLGLPGNGRHEKFPNGIISSSKASLKLLYNCVHKNVIHFNTVVLLQSWESMVSRCWCGSKLKLLWHFPPPSLSRNLRWKIQAHRCSLLCSLLINLLKLFFCSAVGQPL